VGDFLAVEQRSSAGCQRYAKARQELLAVCAVVDRIGLDPVRYLQGSTVAKGGCDSDLRDYFATRLGLLAGELNLAIPDIEHIWMVHVYDGSGTAQCANSRARRGLLFSVYARPGIVTLKRTAVIGVKAAARNWLWSTFGCGQLRIGLLKSGRIHPCRFLAGIKNFLLA
jgi:hypothetical protein